MSLRAFRPENPEQIVPLLVPANHFPWGGESAWVSPGIGPDISYMTAYSAPTYFKLESKILGATRSLHSGSVQSVQNITNLEGEVCFHLVVIDGVDGVSGIRRTADKPASLCLPASSEKITQKETVASALFSFIQLNQFDSEVYADEARAIDERVHEEWQRRSDKVAAFLKDFISEISRD